MPTQPSKPLLFLDESLTYKVAQALALVRYPITNAKDAGMVGVKDPPLIEWMASEGLAWITKDDAAKREHLADIVKHRIHTIWVRGIDRRRNKISPQQLHLMLTVRLPRILEILADARKPHHFMLSLAGGSPRMEEIRDIQTMRLTRRKKHKRPRSAA